MAEKPYAIGVRRLYAITLNKTLAQGEKFVKGGGQGIVGAIKRLCL